jgi:hypothetical protein
MNKGADVIFLIPSAGTDADFDREIAALEARASELRARRRRLRMRGRGRPAKPIEAYRKLGLRWITYRRARPELETRACALRFLRTEASFIVDLGLVIGGRPGASSDSAYRQLLNAVLYGKRETRQRRINHKLYLQAGARYALGLAAGNSEIFP